MSSQTPYQHYSAVLDALQTEREKQGLERLEAISVFDREIEHEQEAVREELRSWGLLV